ncbi:hypothetical protein CB1_000513010 [Camelus ferus]|nr:hypothetical protein CB1_000513010 [Camelus ferus]
MLLCVFRRLKIKCVASEVYNGALPNGDRGRRKSRFALYKRPKANGVKPSTVHVISTPQASKFMELEMISFCFCLGLFFCNPALFIYAAFSPTSPDLTDLQFSLVRISVTPYLAHSLLLPRPCYTSICGAQCYNSLYFTLWGQTREYPFADGSGLLENGTS